MMSARVRWGVALWVSCVGCARTVSVEDAGAPADAISDRPFIEDATGPDVSACRCPGPCADGRCLRAVAIAASISHSCALLDDGTMRCWGDNYFHQIGDGTRAPAMRPVEPRGLRDVRAISVGDAHTCAALGDGSVWCWGGDATDGLETRFGNGLVPTRLVGVTSAIALSSGSLHHCALRSDGSVWCWGGSAFGEAGTLPVEGSTSLRALELSDVVEVRCALALTCARVGGAVRCAGRGAHGQIGDGATTDARELRLVFAESAVEISARVQSACARLADGSVRCWGWNERGMLGDGTMIDRSTPVVVRGVRDATAIAVGRYHGCAIVRDGTVRCWGANDSGQRGTGAASPEDNLRDATTVVGLSGATAIAAGWDHTCALRDDGSVWCWGQGEGGQLGDGAAVSRAAPVAVRW